VKVPPGRRRLCVAYDIAGYSSRELRAQFDAQSRLSEFLGAACASVGLAAEEYAIQQQGDGGLALLPTGGEIDEPRLIGTFMRTIAEQLEDANRFRSQDSRLRLRIALHEGVVFVADHGYVGDAIVAAFRMCDAAPVRRALAESPEADYVLVASDPLYQDVLRHGLYGVPGDAFAKQALSVKSFSADAWIYLAGAPTAPPTSPAPTPPTRPAEPPAAPTEALPENLSLRRILDFESDGW
jgi:class 3 adenylate cyclase